jgi:hypothetical protein
LASRRAQVQEVQMLYVEEHRWSLIARETRPNQIRSNHLGRNPQVAFFWQPINSQL